MYGRIQGYQQSADALAQADYAQSGMGYVTSPEALVAGEMFARSTNEMAGMGATAPTDPTPHSTKKFVGGCVLAFLAGAVAGAVGYHYYKRSH